MAEKKRTPDQILRDRQRIAELKMQSYTDTEIAEVITEETGTSLSRRQITYDVMKIREAWLTAQRDSYNAYITMELARINALENSIWQAMRESSTGRIKTVIERVMGELSDDVSAEDREMIISRVIETKESVAINPAYFTQIADAQKERRKLLGLYAPQELHINKIITTKGYIGVSPNDWPDAIIEGEIVVTE